MLHQMSQQELAAYLGSPGEAEGALAEHAAKHPLDRASIGAALRKAQSTAALEAIQHGTLVYFSEGGNVVGKDPREVLAQASGRRMSVEELMRLAEQLVREKDAARAEELKRQYLEGFYGEELG
ncbi:hypothetical protein DB347_17805 [Opitutaceae bacterium EW11]|nr:hypothetical protein DB347_17805 [Opitutaceae bacterium EW11]